MRTAAPALRLPVLPAAILVAGCALLAWPLAWLAALSVIIALGVPHGALDGEIARTALRPCCGMTWFMVFAVPYLALAGAVLLAWHAAPLCTLAAFLAASVWHFGTEEAAPGDTLQVALRGGLPIAVPLLAHPAATLFVFATIAGAPLAAMPAWLEAPSLAWLGVAAAAVWTALRRRDPGRLLMPALLATLFVCLPPLSAFAIYFVGVHAPAHTAALIANRNRARRVRDERSALLLALPITALTLLIGAALWPLYTGAWPLRLLALTLQILAALTLPHMLLEAWIQAAERRSAIRVTTANRPRRTDVGCTIRIAPVDAAAVRQLRALDQT